MRKRQKDRIIYTTLLIICIVGFWVFENFYTPDSYSSDTAEITKTTVPEFFIPSTTTGEIVNHDHYSLSYHEAYEQAEWVIYTLRKEHLSNDDRERPDFIEDPYVRTKSADWRNYRGSGYDRGHLCPAGDRRFSELAYKETFYTSNISPQDREFNAGIWNELEKLVRYWARRYGAVYVATAGVLRPGLRSIGEEDVAIPEYYYKIVAKENTGEMEVLCFLMPHEPSEASLQEFLVPVDRLEELTGLDYFKSLPDDKEEMLEKEVRPKPWKFKAIR